MSGPPTADLPAALDRLAGWVVVRRVPVCRPHERWFTGPDGRKQVVRVDAADLPDLAERVNRRWEDSGTPVRLTVGHTLPDPDLPETSQPEVVGYGINAVAGTFGPGRVPGVLLDYYVRRDRAEVLRQYPFRSMEYRPEQRLIVGVALLVRDPWLDLGAVHYSAGVWRVDHAADPYAPPPRFAEVMRYMLDRPGLTYDAAAAAVMGGAG